MEENKDLVNEDIFKNLSAGQKKKLKEKMKKEAEQKAAAGGEEPEAVQDAQPDEEEKAGGEEGDDDLYKGMSAAQKKKAKAKAKTDAAAKSGATEQAKPAAGKAAPKTKNSAAAAKILAQQQAKADMEAEEKRLKDEDEAEYQAKLAAEAAELKLKNADSDAKRAERQAKVQELKDKGEYLTKKQLIQKKDAEARRAAWGGGRADEDDKDEQQPAKSNLVRDKKKKNKAKEESKVVQEAKEQAKDDESGEEEDIRQVKKTGNLMEESKEHVKENKEIDLGDDWEDLDLDEIANKIAVGTESQGVGNTNHDSDDLDDEEILDKKNKAKAIEESKKESTEKGGKGAAESSTNVFDRKMTEANKARLEALRNQRKTGTKAKKLRCPIICIMGHVDTGKTKILDKLRKTNVQLGEAGGITQQIGATYFPQENLEKHLTNLEHRNEFNLELPGFLVIDTPGHESFTNLRTRGSSLCDMAVLVVDIMHGLEQQTLESIQLLRQKNTPFCVALNKIDRLNQWDPKKDACTLDTLDSQNKNAHRHFNGQLEKTKLAFAEQSLNTELYWLNESTDDTLSLVPTSAITGEGLSDLMYYLCKMGQTSEREKLTEKDQFECTVLEVKVIEGHGTTIDVVLVNGLLKVGDTIVISGMNGPIQTNIRALLTPQPMQELRVKGEYQHHQKIKGAMGIKISAPGMELGLPGSELFKCTTPQEIEDAKLLIDDDMQNIVRKFVDPTSDGVLVQASTIGSLEALLEYLHQMKIPVAGVNIGPVHRKDVMKATKAINQEKVKKEFATILAFDVKVVADAQDFADKNDIKIFTAQIIYHLFDSFTEYVEKCQNDRKSDAGNKAVFPCILKIIPDTCFNRVSPIIIGIDVLEGELRVGTPLCIPSKDNMRLGTVVSIEANKKPLTSARLATGNVAVKIVSHDSISYGRQFDDSNQIVSYLSRESIDLLKENYRDEMKKEDWHTVVKLKKVFGIY